MTLLLKLTFQILSYVHKILTYTHIINQNIKCALIKCSVGCKFLCDHYRIHKSPS